MNQMHNIVDGLTSENVRSRAEALESNSNWLVFDDNSTPNPPIDPDAWLEIGARIRSIEDEVAYCERSSLLEVFRLRSSLDDFPQDHVRRARNMANFFEVKGGQFMTRAAIKIANVDALFGWKLCQLPEAADENQLLYFVDVFGGPGGCSEYVLWRNDGWNAKGFGYTTRGDYEFHAEMFRKAAPESLDPFYGANDDGNIFEPDNINTFMEYVSAQTDNMGAHLIMCDGGFYIKNNKQEIISKQLYLCLVLLAVGVIRPGGNAILKVFDLYTPFSVGLVYILSKSYKKISIVKPVSSRPANSERYVVCQNRLNDNNQFLSYLLSINQVLWENRHEEHDIISIISAQTMLTDKDFYNFILNSNNDLARRQIKGLKCLINILQGANTQERVDKQVVQETLWRMWKLDHKSDVSPTDNMAISTIDYVLQFVDKNTLEMFTTADTLICDNGTIKKMFGNPHDWSFMPVDVTIDQGINIRTMFLSKGNGSVFYYDRTAASWLKMKELHLNLSPKTLLYGEIVQEISAMGDKQKIVQALHIIDAIMLGGINVRYLPQAQRNSLCSKFAKAMNRPLVYRNNCTIHPIPIRCKKLLPMIEMNKFFNDISIHKLPTGTNVLGSDLEIVDSQETKKFYIPRGLLFARKGKNGLKKIERKFDFDKTFSCRILWVWSKTSQIYSSAQMVEVTKELDIVYREDFVHFFKKCEKSEALDN